MLPMKGLRHLLSSLLPYTRRFLNFFKHTFHEVNPFHPKDNGFVKCFRTCVPGRRFSNPPDGKRKVEGFNNVPPGLLLNLSTIGARNSILRGERILYTCDAGLPILKKSKYPKPDPKGFLSLHFLPASHQVPPGFIF